MTLPGMEFTGGLDMSVSREDAERMGLLLSDQEVLEAMKPEQIVDYILKTGERVSALERAMNLASEVLEGAYGTTVEEILDERNKNGNET